MLNGRNWWTDSQIKFEYKTDLDQRIEVAAKRVWEDWYGSDPEISGLDHFIDAVKQVVTMINDRETEKEDSI